MKIRSELVITPQHSHTHTNSRILQLLSQRNKLRVYLMCIYTHTSVYFSVSESWLNHRSDDSTGVNLQSAAPPETQHSMFSHPSSPFLGTSQHACFRHRLWKHFAPLTSMKQKSPLKCLWSQLNLISSVKSVFKHRMRCLRSHMSVCDAIGVCAAALSEAASLFEFFDELWIQYFHTYTRRGKGNHTGPDLLTFLVASDRKRALCIYTPQPERGRSFSCRGAQTVFWYHTGLDREPPDGKQTARIYHKDKFLSWLHGFLKVKLHFAAKPEQ